MIRIETEEPVESSACPDCGDVTKTLTRFVYDDEDAFAIYYARFSDAHPEHPVKLAIGLGNWSEVASSDDRHSFALELRVHQSQYEVMVTEPDTSPWKNAKVIGRMLNRAEALAHPRIKDVFHITDHIVKDDAALKAFLEKQLTTPNNRLTPPAAPD